MLVIYYLLAAIIWAICLPFILVLSMTKDKYKSSLKARFFLYKNKPLPRTNVHFHACSYGEVRSILSLAKNYDSRASVITQTGYDLAKASLKTAFLPFEIFLPFWFTPCKVLVLFEAELWLMLVFTAKLKGAKVILINARISDKSMHKYKRFAFFYKKIFSYIDEVYAQSLVDKARLEELGAKGVKALFNIKSSLTPKLNFSFKKPSKKVIVFASTHENEEELLLGSLEFKDFADTLFVVVPRHPERFEEVRKLLVKISSKNSLKLSIFSQNSFDESADILLIDALGVLNDIYAISDICVLCGSFIKGIGGHNPVEPASFNNAIISGQFFHNQKSLYQEIQNIYFCKKDELNTLLRSDLLLAKRKNAYDLKQIYQSIDEGIEGLGGVGFRLL